MMDEITIRCPDDWHVHLREGRTLEKVLPFTARQFCRAIVMPNLKTPVTTSKLAADYRREILEALPKDPDYENFTPLMTCYLTNETLASDLTQGYVEGIFTAAKLYPANATTNSDQGVTDLTILEDVFDKMQDIGMPLLVHGEVTDDNVDIFDRESRFIEEVLEILVKKFPELKIVLEHITTKDAIEFVRTHEKRMAATITVHHLLLNRNDIFEGGINPHHYCLPIAKREFHRLALREAATSGDSCFFLGTDTAPHAIADKESNCGCAGIFTAVNALELYAQVFDEEGALAKLEGFASLHGPAFYGLPLNKGTITLFREESKVMSFLEVSDKTFIRPFKAGEVLNWKFKKGYGKD